jgi:hypothetical protein
VLICRRLFELHAELYQGTRRHIPGDNILQNHSCEKMAVLFVYNLHYLIQNVKFLRYYHCTGTDKQILKPSTTFTLRRSIYKTYIYIYICVCPPHHNMLCCLKGKSWFRRTPINFRATVDFALIFKINANIIYMPNGLLLASIKSATRLT